MGAAGQRALAAACFSLMTEWNVRADEREFDYGWGATAVAASRDGMCAPRRGRGAARDRGPKARMGRSSADQRRASSAGASPGKRSPSFALEARARPND
jgi:hypothetical protein